MSPRGQPTMSFGVPPLTRGVKWLGGITVAVSILVAVLGESGRELARAVVFVPDAFFHGRVWQPLTYTFLNPDPVSLLFALLGLWLLGASLEQAWGTRRFVTFYLATGALGALATALLGLAVNAVRFHAFAGNWSSLEGLIAAFAVLMPNAQIFLYFVPVQARWMLPISAGITVLFMLMNRDAWFAYLPQLFGLGAGVLLAGGVAPRNALLRAKVWWIDRRLRRSRLRVVRGGDDKRGPFKGSGSDKYLH
jgi:membrane associated rhomboid family serine protease